MQKLPSAYDPKISESHWQKRWEEMGVYAFRDDKPKAETFVIDTPPPTVSGVLHMGHIFSYTQADFIARYKRMRGFDVFYPMGFDDNGLPTERLVEKTKSVRGSAMPRADFVALCREVVKDAEAEFRKLFTGVALSVDWNQLYQTVSDRVTALSQASFLDLIAKGEAYRDFRPGYWDWVDQTAIATAEIEEKELQGVQITIPFGIMDKAKWDAGERPTFDALPKVHVMTTRPELLGACVGLMCHEDDKQKIIDGVKAPLEKCVAVSPLFNVVVPVCFDAKVDKEKGTGFVMCCSWGDDTDKEWIAKHNLAWRPLIDKDGRIKLASRIHKDKDTSHENTMYLLFLAERNTPPANVEAAALSNKNCFDLGKASQYFAAMENTKLIRDVKNENSAKGKVLKLLDEAGLLIPQGEKAEKIIHKVQMVKCAERSGTPIEIIPTSQWFVKLIDKKEALKAKGAEVVWHPPHMKIRLDQWIDGLKEDWCISRQRFFGVPFPVWYVEKWDMGKNPATGGVVINVHRTRAIYGKSEDLPIDPNAKLPRGFKILPTEDGEIRTEIGDKVHISSVSGILCETEEDIYSEADNELWFKKGEKVIIKPDMDVMDTWATSSISPQISAGAISSSLRAEGEAIQSGSPRSQEAARDDRFSKLFSADLRPQAHEIIRTWAFYTIAKAHLHSNQIPWKNIMISGWCLAADKTKMSKSKGNVVTPVALIEDKGADAVRYWASTSRLATDTAFSEDLLKIGKKLVGKIWNASNLIAQLPQQDSGFRIQDSAEALDRWILSRLHVAVAKATQAFDAFEYCDARVAIEDFFWNDFCDNYLELVKARAYNEGAGQASALATLQTCLETILRLFAPFVPHVTEEIYSHLFADNGSVHQRGSWPVAADYSRDKNAELVGIACIDILNIIRKVKSAANVSIKAPVAKLEIASRWGILRKRAAMKYILPALEDLKAAGNIQEILENPDLRKQSFQIPLELEQGVYITKHGWFVIRVTLAKVEEIARNSEQSPDDKTQHFKVETVPAHGDDRELRAELKDAGNTLEADGITWGVGKLNEKEKEAYIVAKVAMDKGGQGKVR